MYALTKIKLTAKNQQSKHNEKIAVEIEHRLTREDLDEFVREQGYDNYKSYFSAYINDEDILNDVYEDIKNNRMHDPEYYIMMECNSKALQKFILKKYQSKITQDFMEMLLLQILPDDKIIGMQI